MRLLINRDIVSRCLYLAVIIVSISLLYTCNSKVKYKKGKALYVAHCMNCHMPDGNGLQLLIPPVTDLQFLKKNFHQLPCIIKYGMNDTIIVNGKIYDKPMPSHINFTDHQITAILNYLLYDINKIDTLLSEQDVHNLLIKCR